MRSWLALTAVCLAGWVGTQALQAQPACTARTVQDDLGLFSADAKAKANAEIARIKQAYHKDLVIETASPPKKPANLDENDKAAMKKFFDQWAISKFKNEQVDGVYVVILDNPHIVRVEVGPKTSEMGLFTKPDVDELDQKIIAKMKAGDKDGALLTATGFVADTMRRHGQPRVGAAPPGQVQHEDHQARDDQPAMSPIIKVVLIGLGILLVFWIISAIIRGFSAAGRGGAGYGPGAGGPGYGGYGPGYGGGGGFMQNFLGGLLGGAAGMWAYSHFFGGGTPSAWGGEPRTGGGGVGNEPTDVGAGDPYVAGGDYGNDGGGGGDAGGGDAGGGADWGGGGGDAGGGGGDWGGGGGDAGGGGGDWGGGGGGGGDW